MADRYSREDAMRIIPACVVAAHLAASEAQAQTFNDVQIQLGVSGISNDGGERPHGIWFSTGPVTIGKPVRSTFSYGDTCDAWSVSSQTELREDATLAWKIEITPVRVVGTAVTFRLRWVRMAAPKQQIDQVPFEGNKALSIPGNDVELTLRPGESWPIDSVRAPAGAKSIDGRPCTEPSSIRVSVDPYPSDGEERRLVLADLWLVERPSNGGEAQRSQPITVRALPNRSSAFYFDRIVDGKVPLDIYGTFIPRLETNAIAVSFDTRCRWGNPEDSPGFMGPQRSVKTEVTVKPDEVVEIRLPLLGSAAGPYAKREFSIRIRARQLR
jgi:hypothetical protein